TLLLKPDPRIKEPPDAYRRAFLLARQIEDARVRAQGALRDAKTLHDSLTKKANKAAAPRKANLLALDAQLMLLTDLPPEAARGFARAGGRPRSSLRGLSDGFDQLAEAVDGADGAPTADAESGFKQRS